MNREAQIGNRFPRNSEAIRRRNKTQIEKESIHIMPEIKIIRSSTTQKVCSYPRNDEMISGKFNNSLTKNHKDYLTSLDSEQMSSNRKDISLRESSFKESYHSRQKKIKNTEKYIVRIQQVQQSSKKIQDLQKEQRLKNEAKQFVRKLQKKKEQFNGKLYFLKLKKQEKRKQRVQQIQQQQNKKQKQRNDLLMRERLQRIQFFKERVTERQNRIKLSRNLEKNVNNSMQNQTLKDSLDVLNDHNSTTKRKVEKQYGKILKRSKTETGYHRQCSYYEEKEDQKVHNKLKVLRKYFRK